MSCRVEMLKMLNMIAKCPYGEPITVREPGSISTGTSLIAIDGFETKNKPIIILPPKKLGSACFIKQIGKIPVVLTTPDNARIEDKINYNLAVNADALRLLCDGYNWWNM